MKLDLNFDWDFGNDESSLGYPIEKELYSGFFKVRQKRQSFNKSSDEILKAEDHHCRATV